jgi:hypothetical protein
MFTQAIVRQRRAGARPGLDPVTTGSVREGLIGAAIVVFCAMGLFCPAAADEIPVEVSLVATGFYYYYDMGIDPAGWAHAYLDETLVDRLYYATNTGGSWGALQYISPTSDWGSINLSGAVDSNSHSHIAFDGGRAIDYLYYATNRSGSWVCTGVRPDMRWFALDLGPAPDELPRVAYYDNYSGLNYGTMLPGGTWTHVVVDNSGGVATYAGRYPDLYVDEADHGHISYYYYVDQQIRYATNASGSWVWEAVATDPNIQSQSFITRTPQGEFLISYNIGGRVWLARGHAGSWTRVPVTDPGNFGRSDVECDPAGNALVAYNDGTAGKLMLAVESAGGFVHYELYNHQADGDGPVFLARGNDLHVLTWSQQTDEVLYLRGELMMTGVAEQGPGSFPPDRTTGVTGGVEALRITPNPALAGGRLCFAPAGVAVEGALGQLFEQGLSGDAAATITILDATGRCVLRRGGPVWRGVARGVPARDAAGRPLAPGVYFCRVRCAGRELAGTFRVVR